ncbi:uncharacterized protein CTRU02_212245 [Colletotrichum truncatum]|uniref:Uncharacterized protein n=1 Tax=Colletotrichum truncatum TaxID=5467 RepID=A0ACC3YN79_COLTU|nr:uncharacterized protein CTRU02_08876 [Colletotrichum truncatum]KAF6789629.1 hypothetical protein CTRU02_08876 [Colletotrichum truncatum]
MTNSSTYASEDLEPQHCYVDKTPYAHGYQSRYTEEIINGGRHGSSSARPIDMKLLRHVNCGYLSTHGVAPTLLALKQHAQALAILISQITPTSQYAEVNNQINTNGRIKKSFRDNEAFDWLNDLSKPYENDDDWHQKPLVDLMNKVRRQSDNRGIEYHCPLQSFDEEETTALKPRPYAAHSALTMHANDCLEMLDHEYSATGGLMSLLPTDSKTDSAEMAAVRNSLLGQWLLFAQHLVARMHDLELSYANALDVTAGEAAVPMQMLSKIGPDGNSGREIAYPQDKWILANAGDDVFDHLHRMLDRQEAQIKIKEEIWTANGTYGEHMWKEQRGGDLYARGLVFYDVKTRFFRLQGKGKSTIFILPAHGEHPAVQQTRRLEVTPTVVSVITPTWPARVSDWETKYKGKLDEATRMEIQNHEMAKVNHKMQEHNETLATELDRARFMNAQFEAYYTTSEARDGATVLEHKAAKLAGELQDQTDKLMRLEELEARLEKIKPHLPESYKSFLFAPAPGQTEPTGAVPFRSTPANMVSN